MKLTRRLRRETTICSCKSPRLTNQHTSQSFNCYELDLWTEVAKLLDGKSLVKLAMTCRWFHDVIMHDSIWRYACVRDLHVPGPCQVAFDWIELYGSLADGSHSYSFREKEKHIDWMRIGAFFFESRIALLTERLSLPLKISKQDTIEKVLQSCGACVLSNIKRGIWIADLQLVRCPVCELETCEGTMHTLEVRYIELFLCEGYKNGNWKYEMIGSYQVNKCADAASGGIFYLKHIKDSAIAGVFNIKSWAGKPKDLQPKAIITFHSVAIRTNLQENQGLETK